MTTYRAYCFTYNNPAPFEYDKIKCTYIIVGDEIAPETNTPHHQGYIRFKSKTTFNTAKKKLPEGSHIEPAKGSPQQNIAYCSKEKIFFEKGERPKMGRRTDIEKVKGLISEGKGMREIIDETNSYQAMRCGELVLKYKEKSRTEKPIVKWYYGKTGTGKTRKAFEESVDPWISGKNLKWWEGYDAHEYVIIDDFRRDFCTFHELLRILDRYPYRVEVKGGSRQLLAKQIIITSPYHPRETYDTREDIEQLIRRIDQIEEIKINDGRGSSEGDVNPSSQEERDELPNDEIPATATQQEIDPIELLFKKIWQPLYTEDAPPLQEEEEDLQEKTEISCS